MNHKFISLLAVMLAVVVGCANSNKLLSVNEPMDQQLSDIERGRQVVEIMGCNDCHTPDYMVKRANIPEADWLVGGTLGFRSSFGTAYPTNLRLMLNKMSEEEWLVLAKQMSDNSPMAWVMLAETLEQDLKAVYAFVKYLGPKGAPAPTRLPPRATPTTQYVNYPDPH